MAGCLPIPLTARILIVRALPGLGDLLCTVPALRSLRAAYPFAHITWLGLPGTEWFRSRFSDLLDDWLPFPGFPGIPEGWQSPQATVDFLQRIQHEPYDLVLQLHGDGSFINPFLVLLGGRQQGGFYLPGQYCPQPGYFMAYPQEGSEVERLLQFMAFLGMAVQGRELEFPLQEDEYRRGLQTLQAHRLVPGKYLCIHPGASVADRRWPLAEFAQVMQRLMQRGARAGYRLVLTGTPAEQDLADYLCTAVQRPDYSPPVNLAGQTDLGTLAVLLRHSALVICNDTGVSHLAAALRIPSVVVFSNSDVERWAPRDRHRHRIVDYRQTGAATRAAVLAQAQALLPQVFQDSAEVCHAL